MTYGIFALSAVCTILPVAFLLLYWYKVQALQTKSLPETSTPTLGPPVPSKRVFETTSVPAGFIKDMEFFQSSYDPDSLVRFDLKIWDLPAFSDPDYECTISCQASEISSRVALYILSSSCMGQPIQKGDNQTNYSQTYREIVKKDMGFLGEMGLRAWRFDVEVQSVTPSGNPTGDEEALISVLKGYINMVDFLGLQLNHAWGNVQEEDYAEQEKPFLAKQDQPVTPDIVQTVLKSQALLGDLISIGDYAQALGVNMKELQEAVQKNGLP